VFLSLEPLEHQLRPHYPALRAIRTRRALERSALWARIGGEVGRVLGGVERGDHAPAPRPGPLRAAAWNIQRGARLPEVRAALGAPPLDGADLLLLSEVDCGMGRSGNRNVARELAQELGMSYAFGVSYLTLEDDVGENPDGAESTLALAGTAILTRRRIRRVQNVDLPELRDKFSSAEKRLGRKRGLLVEVELDDGPLVVGACHLDSNASPAQRARQLGALLERVDGAGARRALIGGDFNASTFDLSGPLAIARDLVHKLVVTGIRRTLDGLMRPEARYERPLFELLGRRGFAVDGFNDRAAGTYTFDFHDPYSEEKLRQLGGRPLVWLVQRALRRWQGRLPARLDWFAGRGLDPRSACVTLPRAADGRPVSDHAAIVVDIVPAG
jgi:endonuclease/exonuclease/phosphatase family metal-dependent hydrolase